MQLQYMVSGDGDLTSTGTVLSWYQKLGEERIKDWSYNSMLYKTVAKVIVQALV